MDGFFVSRTSVSLRRHMNRDINNDRFAEFRTNCESCELDGFSLSLRQ